MATALEDLYNKVVICNDETLGSVNKILSNYKFLAYDYPRVARALDDAEYNLIYNEDGSLRSLGQIVTTFFSTASDNLAESVNSNFQTPSVNTTVPIDTSTNSDGEVTFSKNEDVKDVWTWLENEKAITKAIALYNLEEIVKTPVEGFKNIYYHLSQKYDVNKYFLTDEKSPGILVTKSGTDSIVAIDRKTLAALMLYLDEEYGIFDKIFNNISNGSQTFNGFTVKSMQIYSAMARQTVTTSGGSEYVLISSQIGDYNSKPIYLGIAKASYSSDKWPDSSMYGLIYDSNYDTNASSSVFPYKLIAVRPYSSETVPYITMLSYDGEYFSVETQMNASLMQTYQNKSVQGWYRNLNSDKDPTFTPSINYVPYDTLSTTSSTLYNQLGYIAWTFIYNQQKNKTSWTVDEVDNELQQTYPDVYSTTYTQDVLQPDGTDTVTQYVYVPLYTVTENEVTNTIPTISTPTSTPGSPTTELPTTGTGVVPVPVIPTGDSTALYAIYNPTKTQINSFGAWLWSSNFIDQLLKLFSDPMQAIIGLHKVYCTPVTNDTESNIKVGYLDSGVSSKTVKDQYTTIDCGSVSVRETFNNVFDYEPFTRIQLFLPFIGVVPLSVADVMRSTIRVKYTVDVLTGACLAEVIVTRDNSGGSLYQYGGNCAISLPVSSGSYMGIVSSLVSVAGGVAATVASGGAAAPTLLGSVGSLANAHTTVQHSGGFSGNTGVMGNKKPYLIISKPQTALAGNYESYEGIPANSTVTIGNCSGFVRMKEVHIEGVSATRQEIDEINTLCKTGILV